MTQSLNAALIGIVAALVCCAVLILTGLVGWISGHTALEWLFLAEWPFLPMLTGHLSGRVLSRRVHRWGALAIVLLATPGFYIALAFALWVLVRTGTGELFPLLVIPGIAFFPSLGLTAWGFYRSPHRAPPIGWSVCAVCKYDLRGNESGRCPECGTAILEEQQKRIPLA